MQRNVRLMVLAGLSGCMPGTAIADSWRICIGEDFHGKRAYISDVIDSDLDRTILEDSFDQRLTALGLNHQTVQCRRGEEKVLATNARDAAETFNKAMGFSVQTVR